MCLQRMTNHIQIEGSPLVYVRPFWCSSIVAMTMTSHYTKLLRGVARILLKGVLNLVSLTRPFLQLVGCIMLTSLATF